jgi:hypothetical protein
MPLGKADLGVVQSTLREERARRALLLSKAGRLLAIEILESVLQGCFGCDDHASRFRHQLRMRIQRSDSETRKLRCLRAFDYLDTPRDFARTGLALSVAVVPGQIDTTATLYSLKSCAISNVSLSRPAFFGTVGRIKVVGDGSIIGNIHHKRPSAAIKRVQHSSSQRTLIVNQP